MKRFLLMVAAAAAVMFTSCSNETSEEGLEGQGGVTAQTYATFTFKIDGVSTTRAVETDGSEPAEGNSGTQKINSIRFMIFNESTGVCEVNDKITSPTSASYLVSAGTKKIYALANMTTEMETLLDAYTANGNTKFHLDFLEEYFDAKEANKVGFSLLGLYNATGAFPMSSTSGTTYTLAPNIKKEAATDGLSSASPSGTSPTNSFSISIGYMLSKVKVGVKSGITTANFADAKFSVRNVARKTSLVQKIIGGNEYSWYSGKEVLSLYETDFDRTSVPLVSVPTTGFSQTSVYVAENNNSNITTGQASYVALNCEYKPQVVVAPTGWPLTKATNPSEATYYMLTQEYKFGERSIPAGTCFQNIQDVVLAIKYMISPLDPTAVTEEQWNAVVGTTTIKNQGSKNVVTVATYTGAQSYYRINLGVGNGASTKYGVVRGNIYQVTVNAITSPGYPSVTGLDNGWRDDKGYDKDGGLVGEVEKPTDWPVKPEDPIDAQTAVAVSIIAKTWNVVSQGADL